MAGRPGTPGLRTITLTDDAVLDCWRVQGWGKGLNPDAGPEGYAAWLAHPSTQNYVRRLSEIPFTLDRSRLDGPDKLT